jgi:xanthine dehydrogenase accessory factor
VAADANLQTFDKVDELITQYQLTQVKTSATSFIVVATQGDNDEKALEEALKKTAAYVGFVSSRKKMQSLSTYLKEVGCIPEKVDAIHSPAGIDINAKKPEEVALSILAEIIQVKNGLDLLTVEDHLTDESKPAGVPDYYINPVCGVPVDKNNPKHIREFEGEKVYFCCDGCTVKFDKDPAKYINARNLGLAPEGM